MNAKKFLDELVSRLKETAGDKMVVHPEEALSGVTKSYDNQHPETELTFEFGRSVDYYNHFFYLSIRSKKRLKKKKETTDNRFEPVKNDFRNFLENTILELFKFDPKGRKIKITAIPLKRYDSVDLETEESGRIIYRLERLIKKHLNSSLRSSEIIYEESIAVNKFPTPNKRVYSVKKSINARKEASFISDYLIDPTESIDNTQKYLSYPVLYGTNRKKKIPEKRGKVRFGEERDEQLNLGACKVSIPGSHRQGELERPGWFRDLFYRESPEKDFMILYNEVIGQSRFVELLKERFTESGQNDVLLFIHGFNTDFEDSLYRTAQLGYDLCFKGAVTAFSWPSRGKALNYVSDTQSAEYSIPFLSEFIKRIVDTPAVGKLHIIAHSMGNVVLCGALKKLKEEGVYPGTIVNQVILAAPDIDRDVFFMQIMPAIKTTHPITLYACDKDHALKLSKTLRSGYVRLGEGGENLLVTDGLDSIDASEVDMSILGHTYFAQTPSLLNEIHMVLQELPPGKRMLKECINARKQKYWALKRT